MKKIEWVLKKNQQQTNEGRFWCQNREQNY